MYCVLDGEGNCDKYIPIRKRLSPMHVVATTNSDNRAWGSLSNDRWVVLELLHNNAGVVEIVQRVDPHDPIKDGRSNALEVSFIEQVLMLHATNNPLVQNDPTLHLGESKQIIIHYY